MINKKHRIFATIIVVLIIITMTGSGIIAIIASGFGINQSGSSSSGTTASTTASQLADYQAQKTYLDQLVQQAKADTANIPLQKTLGDKYYTLGVTSIQVAPTETQANFKQAVEAYQVVLTSQQDVDVMVDMGTAAYYSGDTDLAEKMYKQALAIKSDHYNGLVNYGIFLADARQNWAEALIQWQKALPLAQSSSDKTQATQIEAFIAEAQTQLKTTP